MDIMNNMQLFQGLILVTLMYTGNEIHEVSEMRLKFWLNHSFLPHILN